MEIVYKSNEVKIQCTSVKAANKLFGGNVKFTRSLLARINALKQATIIKDIIVQPTFRFHNLENKYGKNYKGFFAIDVKSKKDKWRIILRPLDEDKKPYNPCNIDCIAGKVRIVEILEVSNHYE